MARKAERAATESARGRGDRQMQAGRFRDDLSYGLAVARVWPPPSKEAPD